MNVFTLYASFATRTATRSWTCATCRTQLVYPKVPRPLGPLRTYASGRGNWQGGGKRKQGPRRTILYASSGAAVAGVSALAFTDDIKSGYESVERTGRVAAALGLCVQE